MLHRASWLHTPSHTQRTLHGLPASFRKIQCDSVMPSMARSCFFFLGYVKNVHRASCQTERFRCCKWNGYASTKASWVVLSSSTIKQECSLTSVSWIQRKGGGIKTAAEGDWLWPQADSTRFQGAMRREVGSDGSFSFSVLDWLNWMIHFLLQHWNSHFSVVVAGAPLSWLGVGEGSRQTNVHVCRWQMV